MEWNILPKNLKTERHSYQPNNKKENEKVFLEKFKIEINLPKYNEKCCKDFKFHKIPQFL